MEFPSHNFDEYYGATSRKPLPTPQVPIHVFSSLSIVSKKRKLSWVEDFDGHPFDVLLGEYEYAKHHPGNIEFGKWISESYICSAYAYQSLERWQNEIVQKVKSHGGRFLKPEDPTKKRSEAIWLLIGDDEARKLVEDYSIVHTQIPTKDILHGHSPTLRMNDGNAWLRKICKQNYDAYYPNDKDNDNDGTKQHKTQISDKILMCARAQGRRFLKEVFIRSKLWAEMDKIKARDKVASTFRGMTKAKNRNMSKKRATNKGDDDIERFSSFLEDVTYRVDGSENRKRKALSEGDDSLIEQKRFRNLNSTAGEYALALDDEAWNAFQADWLKSELGEFEVHCQDLLVGKVLSNVFDLEEEMEEMQSDEDDDDKGDDEDDSSTDGEQQNDAGSDKKDKHKKDRDEDENGGGDCGNTGDKSDEHDDVGRSNNGHRKEDDSQRKNSKEDGGNNERKGSDSGGANKEKNDNTDKGEYSNGSNNESDSSTNDVHYSDDDSDNDDDDDDMCADLRLKQLVVSKFDSYCSSNTDQKQEITKGVLETLLKEGWLFLRQPSIQKRGVKRKASWLYVGDSEAQVTVAHTFRALERLEQLKVFNTRLTKVKRTYIRHKKPDDTSNSVPGELLGIPPEDRPTGRPILKATLEGEAQQQGGITISRGHCSSHDEIDPEYLAIVNPLSSLKNKVKAGPMYLKKSILKRRTLDESLQMINTEIGSMGAGIDQSIVDNIASDTVFPPMDGGKKKSERVGISSSEATAKRRHSMPTKQFGFSTVTIREYPRALGDNIPVMGPPVSLEWEHEDETVYDLIEYDEAVSDTRRKESELKMPSKLRNQILRDSGYTKQEIKNAVKKANIGRQQRKRTVERLKLGSIHEAFENMTRFGKKPIRKKNAYPTSSRKELPNFSGRSSTRKANSLHWRKSCNE